MKAMIDKYQNFPGQHCGSVAMRGLLHHYCGLDLPENAVFGLGAGLECIYLAVREMSPAFVFGRSATMETDLARALGVDYSEQNEADDDRAWQVVREEVLAGRPTMLSGDIYYLDYREFKVHFPGHRFVLLGFDDDAEAVHIADRVREEPEVCSYSALARSRNPPDGMSTHNLWGRFGGGAVLHDRVTAIRTAIDTCARRMLGERHDVGEAIAGSLGPDVATGIAGIRRLAEEIPSWQRRHDAADVARYNASCIEKFGNGGGNFRRMYAGFLAWAREADPERIPPRASELALQSADRWTALSGMLQANAEGADRWDDAAREAMAIADIEQSLFEGLVRPGV